MVKRTFGAAFLSAVWLFSLAVSQRAIPSSGQKGKPDFSDVPLPLGAIELKLDRRFPDQEGQGPFLSSPHGIAMAPSGCFYISDQTNNEIYVFSSDGKPVLTFGRTGSGPGDFLRPSDVVISRGDLLVREPMSGRIQRFDQSGKLLGGFKTRHGYQAIAAIGDRIYAANLPIGQVMDEVRPNLVDILDLSGQVIKSFGAFYGTALEHPIPFTKLVDITSASQAEIWVAFRFYPVVRRYSMDGALLGDFHYRTRLSEEKEDFNARSLKAGAEWLAFLTQSAYATERGLYLIDGTAGHRLLIMLMTKEGRMEKFYWAPLKENLSHTGLVVLDDRDEINFFILDSEAACVNVYSERR